MLLNYSRYYHNIRQFIIKYFPLTRVAVQIIIENKNKILLVKHNYTNEYYFPGGGVKRGESLKKAIIREVSEELGITVKNPKLYQIYQNYKNHHNDYIFLYHTSKIIPKKSVKIDNREIKKYLWVPIRNISKLQHLLSPATYKIVKEYQPKFNQKNIKLW